MLRRVDIEHWMSHWGRSQRTFNINGWDRESIVYKIMKRNILIPLRIEDCSDVDLIKAGAVNRAMNELELIDSDCVYVLSRLYCDKWSIRRIAGAAQAPGMPGWSKSHIGRIKNRGLDWMAQNVEHYLG